jgi:hypothetical protein
MRMSTHPYKYTYAHPIYMSTSKRLGQFDLEIYEIDHQECLAIDEKVTKTERIVYHKYNTHIKFKI